MSSTDAPAAEPSTGPAPRRPAWLRFAPLLAALAFFAALAAWMSWRYQPAQVQGPAGKLVYSDDFDRAEPGPDYLQGEPDPGWKAGNWTIVDGRLRAEKIHNAALWLQKPLPEKVRIEFDARAESEEGDVKVEVFGDGRTHQSGYILIFGGWKNSINIIARRDEHAEERKEDRRCRPRAGGRPACVEPGVDYHWTIERTDGEVRWSLDGRLFMVYDDADPVRGRHFAFNNWEAPVTFDALRIYDLSVDE